MLGPFADTIRLQPPISFQPMPPAALNQQDITAADVAQVKPPPRQAQQDLIQRYNLQDKVVPASASSSAAHADAAAATGKGWSSNKDEAAHAAAEAERRDDPCRKEEDGGQAGGREGCSRRKHMRSLLLCLLEWRTGKAGSYTPPLLPSPKNDRLATGLSEVELYVYDLL